jgi:RNA polymerase sigma-70 factor (ECF subfamily)
VRAEPATYADRADEWLVERCRGSVDEAAFAELVRRYREPVFRLAVSILGQEFAPEAEDVAQDVMLRVHHALGSFRGESRFGSWIYRIAFNRALNVKARARYRAPHLSEEVLATAPSRDRDPHDQLQDERRRQAVLACVGELPEVYQSALRLHYWLGASVSDIAVMLDAPENTVKSYLHRARRLLHALLAERGFDAR